jgi:hypothetical protein
MLTQLAVSAPRIVERKRERMAVVQSVGDPAVDGSAAVALLYDAIAGLGLDPGTLRARWPNASDHEKDEWIAHWAMPVPDGTPELGGSIRLEDWYGQLVAEILHVGPFNEQEVEAVRRLQRFIGDCGYEIAGPAEEEYVRPQGAEPQRTIIRYEIRESYS